MFLAVFGFPALLYDPLCCKTRAVIIDHVLGLRIVKWCYIVFPMEALTAHNPNIWIAVQDVLDSLPAVNRVKRVNLS